MSKIIQSISDIISQYDVFILDQWGVMHDGYKGYECAINSFDFFDAAYRDKGWLALSCSENGILLFAP